MMNPNNSISGISGILAASIGIGSIVFFTFNAPNGYKDGESAFGFYGKYKHKEHGTIIPSKALSLILGGIAASLVIAAVLLYLGY
jgi:ABC-type multidrug transport system permease subunit